MPTKKILLILLVLFPVFCFSQVVIQPGEQVIIKAGSCPTVSCPPATTVIVHDTIWQCPPPAPPPVIVEPPAVGYSLSYSNDYEQASDINTNQLGLGKQTVFEGRGVFWAEYKAGGAAISSGYRSEQEYNLKYFPQANPVEGKLSVEMYFKDYKPTGWGAHSLQAHPNNNNSAVFLLYHTEGQFNFARSLNGANFYQSGTLKPIEANKWYKVSIEFKWSSGADGYFRCYVDGVLQMSYKGPTQDGSGQPYWKIGINFFNNKSSGIVLYDNLNIYKKS